MRKTITYFLQSPTGGNIKIGKTTNHHKRRADLSKGAPDGLVVLGTISTDLESELHKRFRYLDSGHPDSREWFIPDPAIISFIVKFADCDLAKRQFLEQQMPAATHLKSLPAMKSGYTRLVTDEDF